MAVLGTLKPVSGRCHRVYSGVAWILAGLELDSWDGHGSDGEPVNIVH